MRACLLLGALACAWPLVAAPAPRTRPVVFDAVFAVPDNRSAFDQIDALRSDAFLAPLARSPQPARSAEWLRRRLRIEAVLGGRALRLTLRDCDEEEGWARMHVIQTAYFNAHIPDRERRRHEAAERAEKDMSAYNERSGGTLWPKHRAMIRDYFARLATRAQEMELTIQEPRVCWARR